MVRSPALGITNRGKEAGIVDIYRCFVMRCDRKRSRDKNSANSTSPSASCSLLESVLRLLTGDSAKLEGVVGQLREVESKSTQQVSQ
jgi:hypothetical protein